MEPQSQTKPLDHWQPLSQKLKMMHKSLIQKMKIFNFNMSSRLISGESSLLRRLSTSSPARPRKDSLRNPNRIDKYSLYKMISSVESSTKVSSLLYELVSQGKQFNKNDLVSCVKTFRKFGRFQHCLEILEWMEKRTVIYAEADYALRLGIICNLKGIDEAHKYFDSLPPAMKNRSAYGALLNCYCMQKTTEKALAIFEKMDELNYISNKLPFNNLMSHYMKVGQPEKVPSLVQAMKKRKIPLNDYSYSIWIQSYGCLKNLEGLERVVNEVQEHDGMKNAWNIYSSLASAYIKIGQSEKAKTALKKLDEVLDNSYNPEREAYYFLITLCADNGDLELVTQAWNKFKSKFKACNNSSYLTMLKALSKLGDIEGLKTCFKEWESSYQSYDVRLPVVVISAYLKQDMVEEAELLLKDSAERSGQNMYNAHLSLANYYLDKRQIDSALRHLELAVHNKRQLLSERINPFFEYFKQERDVDGAEEFCRILKKDQSLGSGAYLWLLQVYADAGKTALEMRQRMEKDGVEIGTEHEELLMKVCPS